MTTSLRALLAIDGSQCSRDMAGCWATWHSEADSSLVARLLTIVAPPLRFWATPGVDPDLIEGALRSIGRARLAEVERLTQTASLSWESAVRIGHPAEDIVTEARQWGADLIVMGTRGLSALRTLLVGSVALRVAQSSSVPVWLMPPDVRCPVELGRRLKLLVAVDGSEAANRAAAWSARIAPRFGDCSIDLVSVRPALAPIGAALGMPTEGIRDWNEQLGSAAISSARAAMGDTVPCAAAHITDGHVVHELCLHAARVSADAIVVGPRDLGVLGRVTLGSVSSALLQTSSCSVIIVREAVV